MSKNLRKKLLRDIRQNFIQFLAIFVMCFLTMLMLEGFDAILTGLETGINENFQRTNFMDLCIFSEGFTEEDISAVRSVPGVVAAEPRATVNGKVSLSGTEYKIEYNFINTNTVSSMYLTEGEAYKPETNGIWIDGDFAARQGIHVGDVLQLTCEGVEFSEPVKGIMYNPDHVYYIVDDTFSEPDRGAYGYAFLDAGEYPGTDITYESLYVDIDGIENKLYYADENRNRIEQVKQKIMQVLSKQILEFTPKHDATAYNFIEGDIDSNSAVGTIFPILFLSIALLGIMTTMTRLVMKQRTLIGTLKALGFSQTAILAHYVSYSVAISFAGSILGAVTGWWTLGKVLDEQYDMYYSNPFYHMQLSWKVVAVILLIVVLAGLTNYLSCRKLLVQRASDILRPEPPQVMGAGFLEKTPIWKKLSFASKWNLRDINRNKIRTIAGLLGVILCSALLLSAFGANKLFKSEENWQYRELTPSEYTIGFAAGVDYSTVYDYARQYQGQMVESVSTNLTSKNMTMLFNVGILDRGNLYWFQDEDGKYIDLPKNGIAISSRAMKALGMELGDTVSFKLPGDSNHYSGRVMKVYKDPALQGIFMTREYFESMGGSFLPNTVYTNMTVPSDYVDNRPEISSVFSKTEYIEALRRAGETLDTEVLYIMVIAVVIGIVVMYNLGMLSFVEKVREIATLKVLGFSTNKIRWILQQQNIVITGIGTAIGLLIGRRLLIFLMNQLDVDADYIYHIGWMPYLLAFILSFVLSLVVNALISGKVKDIDMVEALKGVE